MADQGPCTRCRFGGATIGRKVHCERFRKIVHPSAGNVCQGFSEAERGGGGAFDADWRRKYELENPRED